MGWTMLTGIIGDVIGSVYEHHPTTSESFPLFSENSRFTDDTVMTIAVADAVLNSDDDGPKMKYWGRQ